MNNSISPWIEIRINALYILQKCNLIPKKFYKVELEAAKIEGKLIKKALEEK